MKQKIALIATSMSKPKILILDEPTAGLDPVMQEQFYKLIFKMKDEKTNIIICSHIFEEVVKLCDQVGFIKDGKLIEQMIIKNNDINEIETHFKKLYERKDFL